MRLVPTFNAQPADDAAVLIPYLIERGLTEADLLRVVSCQRAQELRLSEALLHLGLLTPTELATARQHSHQQPRPVAGALPSSLLMVRDPFHPVAEQVRTLRAELLRKQPDAQFNRIAVVGANAAEGRSALAASLAIACAQLDQPTLLIDADLRKPSQHALFSLPREPGLANLLERGTAPHIVSISGAPQLSVLTAGMAVSNPLELLSSKPFADFIDGCRHHYRHVIVDVAAAERGADAVTVAAAAGCAVSVARLNHTLLADAQGLSRRLESARVNLLGAVLLKSAL